MALAAHLAFRNLARCSQGRAEVQPFWGQLGGVTGGLPQAGVNTRLAAMGEIAGDLQFKLSLTSAICLESSLDTSQAGLFWYLCSLMPGSI